MIDPTLSVDNDVKKLCYHDVVYKFDEERNRIAIGDVTMCYQAGTHLVKEGQIMVRWDQAGHAPALCEESDVHLMSRYITRGDLVKRVKGSNETGICTKTEQMVAVLIAETDGLVVDHVDAKRLYKFPLREGSAVCFGDIAGISKESDKEDTLRFLDCGSRVKIRSRRNYGRLRNVRPIFVDNLLHHSLYVGSCIPNNLLDPVWLNKSESMKAGIEQNFVVESEQVASVFVHWITGPMAENKSLEGEDIGKLNIFHHPEPDNVRRMGYYKMKLEPNDVVNTKSKWLQEKTLMLMPDRVQKKEEVDNGATSVSKIMEKNLGDITRSALRSAHNHTMPLEGEASCLIVQVLYVENKVTVLWQDGTEEKHIPATELIHFKPLVIEHFFFLPGDWVIFNKSDEKKCGVVRSVDFAERVAQVKWLAQFSESSPSRSAHSRLEHIQSRDNNLAEHSVYDLMKIPYFNLELWDIFCKPTINGAVLGTIINITSKSGAIVVQWSDGSTEECWPGGGEYLALVTKNSLRAIPPNPNDHSSVHLENERTESDKESEKMSVDDDEPMVDENEGFCVLDEAPKTHKYYFSVFEPKNQQKFAVALQREYRLLKESLPAGVWVRTYEDRTDLLSVMIRGAEGTPYEDGLFLFDIQLCADYPEKPPQVHFISYINERLNPNLYVEGKVCVSLLGTWRGQNIEVWTTDSNLLQVIVSMQGLILVAEPFYNEPGYETWRYTQEGEENSRTYNESVILSVLRSMDKLLKTCPREFQSAVLSHLMKNGEKMCRRLEGYSSGERADYPLLPVSRGFKLALELHIRQFRQTLTKVCQGPEQNQVSC